MFRSVVAVSMLMSAAGCFANDNITINMLANYGPAKNCFHQMVKAHKLPSWVIKNAKSFPTLEITVKKQKYQVMNACNPQDCDHEQIAIIYSLQKNVMSGVFAVTENADQQKLIWLGVSDELSVDGKTILYAAITGSLAKHPKTFSYD